MKLGTKSVLFGAHQFLIHPWFVAAAWWKLFGFPFDPRLWAAFFVHDIGYIGKPNMDGEEGELHPFTGARIMGFLFGAQWHDFCLYHSRFLAKKFDAKPSRLCIADKLAICLQPEWLYLPAVRATGEIHEYMKLSQAHGNTTHNKYASMGLSQQSQREWYRSMQAYVRKWVAEHKDGREDTWTPKSKVAKDSNGVWQ